MAHAGIIIHPLCSKQLPTKVELDAVTTPAQKKGAKIDLDNYAGIRLIHPIGRLFSKVLNNHLESDNYAIRATC